MNIALFGRHPSPAEHIVFPEGIPEDKMDDYSWMKAVCSQWLYDNDPDWVTLYVEGFTPALIAFLQAWDDDAMLKLKHYQPDGTYLIQMWP
tara:strand:+ start:12495 stop:12767 length:273 start_codon:yes stop_codon:yes gene_type:complete